VSDGTRRDTGVNSQCIYRASVRRNSRNAVVVVAENSNARKREAESKSPRDCNFEPRRRSVKKKSSYLYVIRGMIFQEIQGDLKERPPISLSFPLYFGELP